ncbi:MAG: GntR family transcriptional regulator [Limnochordaceae bacterium]|nr:GntR family transcriptional regulator [Limnochordaceae bacterium]
MRGTTGDLVLRRGTPRPHGAAGAPAGRAPADAAAGDGATKADKAYRALHRMIVTMELPPGSVIDERLFAARFGIGRTPLREAVERLVEQRLVVSSAHRPSQVAPLELTDVQAICELRALLEPFAARLASRRATDADLARMEALLDRYRAIASPPDVREAIQVDYAFHEALARSAGNPHLEDAIDRLNAHSQRLWFLSLRLLDSLEPIVREHEAVLAAIRQHDGDGADRAMQEHIESFKARIRTLL